MPFSCFRHPPSPSAHSARPLYPGPQEGQGIMVFRRVPSRGAPWRAPRTGAQVRSVAKTPPSLAHPRSTPETPREERFEFLARMFCGVFFQPHTKIAASGAQKRQNCSKTYENRENFTSPGRPRTPRTPLHDKGSPSMPQGRSGAYRDLRRTGRIHSTIKLRFPGLVEYTFSRFAVRARGRCVV